MKSVLREIAHFIFRVRAFNNNSIKKFAKGIKNKRILELGSGKRIKGKYYYSAKRFFDDSNEFIQSDIIRKFGHKIVDATKMKFHKKFDIILCMNVLEHIFDFHKAILNIYQSLKENGITIIFVPGFYPLHDEPNDFWRFTEHSLKKILKNFKKIKIKHSGLRRYPLSYYVEAHK